MPDIRFEKLNADTLTLTLYTTKETAVPKAAILVFLEGNRRPAKIELDEVVVASILSPLTVDTTREERVLGHATVECLRALEAEKTRATAPVTLGVDPIPDGAADPAPPIADPVPPETADPVDGPDGLGTLTLA